MDKNLAIVQFLAECPQIQANPLFFNFINAKDNSQQVITQSNDRSLQTPFIDGSVQKRYAFTIVVFKSINHNPIVKQEGYADENIDELFDVQGIIDWIVEQQEARNYPDFGTNCIIDEMRATTENPNLQGVDTSVKPSLAQYAITIQIDYIDISKRLWK